MTYIPNKQNKSLFNEEVMTQRTNIIELKSNYGLSALRDVTTETANGTVTNANGSYTLATTADGSDAAELQSAERGRYIAGQVAQAGIGVRTATEYAGNMISRWGLFDDNNGFGFGVDATGIFIFDRKAGTETKVYQANWNGDTLDGNGGSGLTLNLADGHIFNLVFSWYGYGTIEFRIFMFNPTTKEQVQVVAHRLRKEGGVSVENPNLPITAKVENGGTATAASLEVTGRQYSTYGNFNPNRRINNERRLAFSGIGTTFVPLISFRRKSAFNSVSVKVEGVSVLAGSDLVLELRFNSTLTNPSWGTPTRTSAAETACETDTSATAISGGELLYTGLASGNTGFLTSRSILQDLNFDIPALQPVTLCVRSVSGTVSGSAVLRWREEW